MNENLKIGFAIFVSVLIACGIGVIPTAVMIDPTNQVSSLPTACLLMFVGLFHSLAPLAYLWGWMMFYEKRVVRVGGAMFLASGLIAIFFPPAGPWIGITSILLGVAGLLRAERKRD